MATATLLVLTGVACGEESNSGELDLDTLCEAADPDTGAVSGADSWDENRAILSERVDFLGELAAVAEREDAPAAVADAASEFARRFEVVISAPSNEELQMALTEVMTDEALLARGREMDAWLSEVCADDSR